MCDSDRNSCVENMKSIKVALVTLSVVLAAVAAIALTCLLTLHAQPGFSNMMYQPDRSANVKTNALMVDLNDKYGASNKPGCVMADNESRVANLPSEVAEGEFYALWDCEMLSTNTNGKARILVTLREMRPVSGRVWTNWYDWDHWTGWKSTTPE